MSGRFSVLGRWLRSAALICLMTVVFAAAAELATRALSAVRGDGWRMALHELDPQDRGVRDIYRWHPFTGFTFVPDAAIVAGHPNQKATARIATDRYGFLAGDNGLTPEKPADEIRVACIGGSTTACINLPFEQAWPGRLGALLQRALPNSRVRVINAGVPGFDTAQSVGNLILRVLPFAPDLVIVYHGYNDLKAVRPDRPFRADYSHIHTTPYGYRPTPPVLVRLLNHSMFYVRLRNRYRRHRLEQQGAGATAAAAADGRLAAVPAEARAAFCQHVTSMVAAAQASGSRVLLAGFATLHDPGLDLSRPADRGRLTPFQRRSLGGLMHFVPGLRLAGIFDWIRQSRELLAQIAHQRRCGWVDAGAAVPHEDRFFVDRVHFSRDGAARMAEALAGPALALLTGTGPPATCPQASRVIAPADRGRRGNPR